MAFYPIMLSLKGKRCLVVGGGPVAERKVAALLESGADRVEVVSPDATPELQRLAAAGSIRLLRRAYIEEDALEATLLFAATGDRAVNGRAAADGERAGALVNIADEGETGDFVTPSVVRRGELLLAITTGGASPALAALLKRELEERFPEEYASRVAALRMLRERIRGMELGAHRRRQLLRLAAEAMLGAAEAETDARLEGTAELIDIWIRQLMEKADRRHKE